MRPRHFLSFFTTRFIRIFIAVTALLFAYFIQEVNLNALRDDGVPLREQKTIKTADDISYLSPARNYYNTGRIYGSEVQKYQSVTRSPGYGALYGIMLTVLGPENALSGLKWIQLLLYGISIYLLFGIATHLIKHTLLAYVVVVIYALLPFSHGFIYYTLTEGVTPSLSIIFFSLLLYAHRLSSVKWYLISAFLLCIIIAIRPFLLLFAIPLVGYIYMDFHQQKKQLFKALFFSLLISWMFMGAWQIRNYIVLDKFTGLHPIYQKEIPGVFRPVHASVWNFYKGFEHRGDHFHEALIPFWQQSLQGDTSKAFVVSHVSKLPIFVRERLSTDQLTAAFSSYQYVTSLQKEFLDRDELIPKWINDKETKTAELFDALASDFRGKEPFIYHVKTPANALVQLLGHSNLSLYIFQKKYRGRWWMESLRALSFLLCAGSFLLCFLTLVVWKKLPEIALVSLPIILAIFYLSYFQRGTEERYLLPFLPMAFVIAAGLKTSLLRYIMQKMNQPSLSRKSG
ncbi:MAG: hypothetical protein P8O07_09845 [Crocinitomicaceae bacterium]|nr:hypothetical protein [Crocinitomicaceae bacterium]